jgi:hypothetical protein
MQQCRNLTFHETEDLIELANLLTKFQCKKVPCLMTPNESLEHRDLRL